MRPGITQAYPSYPSLYDTGQGSKFWLGVGLYFGRPSRSALLIKSDTECANSSWCQVALNLHFIAILTNLNAGKESDLKRGPLPHTFCSFGGFPERAFYPVASHTVTIPRRSPQSARGSERELRELAFAREHGCRRRAAVCRAARARVVTRTRFVPPGRSSYP